jgi:type I restriction enzyme, S subunit
MTLIENKNDWKPVRLDEVLAKREENDRENARSRFDTFVKVEHMEAERLNLLDVGSQKEKELPPTFYKIFRKGQVLFPTRNPHLRRTALAHCDGICGEKTLTLEVNGEVADRNLIPFLFHSANFYDHTAGAIIGSTNPHCRWRDVANYEFLLPPKDQQAKLAELLWAADAEIETHSSLENHLRTYTHVSALDLLGLSKSAKTSTWAERRLEEIAPLQRGHDLPNSQLINGSHPVCYSNGVRKHHAEYKVPAPGVVTGRSGTIGNVFYLEEDFWPHNTTLWVTSFCGNAPRFVYHLYKRIKLERVMAGTGVPTLNRNDVHKLKAKVPGIEEQVKIAKAIDLLEEKVAGAAQSKSYCKRLLKSLINQIF